MQKTNFRYFYSCVLTIVFSFSANTYADDDTYPVIAGTWINKTGNTGQIVSKYTFIQNEKHLSGQYIDEQAGKEIANSPIVGYIDKQGGVIFDLYFGKVTATNRLSLSDDKKQMKGTFTTTMGNNGIVNLIKSE